MKQLNYWLVNILLISTLPVVLANPVEVFTESYSIQDDWILNGWVEELGVGFPAGEEISAVEVPWGGHIPCSNDWQHGTSVQISISNMTGKAWEHLYYVADTQTELSNWDEGVGDVNLYTPTESFKIDAVGENTPLVYESMTQDGVFEIGETWEFVIQDFVGETWFNLETFDFETESPAAFGSLGLAGASHSPMGLSSGSIIAIPEPSSIVLIGLVGGFGVFIRRLMM
jgi:hypothetical protein